MITARHFLVTREVEPGGNKKTRASAETDALGPEHRIFYWDNMTDSFFALFLFTFFPSFRILEKLFFERENKVRSKS